MSKRHPERVTLNRLGRWLAGGAGYRLMYDSYAGTAIPDSAPMVAGYTWWTAAEWARFKGKPALLIATSASENRGDVLDCENGDATASQCEGWIRMRKAAGYFRPTIYTSGANVGNVRVGTGQYKLGVDYDLWVADWTGHPFEYPGAVATQYANIGTLYDLTAVYDAGWPHREASKPEGPFKRSASGAYSLVQLADARHTTQTYLADLVMQHGTLAERNKLVNFLIREGPGAKLPKGLVLYTFHSGGTI